MSHPAIPAPAKLIASLIVSRDSLGTRVEPCREVKDVMSEMEEMFGPIDYQSPVRPFTQTAYYNKEMGDGLLRLFVGFAQLVSRDRLADIKLATNRIEQSYVDQAGGRRINIDPGLLSVENLVLATGKNFTHRIYLKDGIFAEVTLLYQGGRFQALPWTYWDYTADEVIEIMETLRQDLLGTLKKSGQL